MIRGFKIQFVFIFNFMFNFEVGVDKVQFVVVMFFIGVYKNFYLNEYVMQVSVFDVINKIQYRDGEMYIDLGLNYV